MLEGETLVNAIVTCVFSYLSLIGSIFVALSYLVARTKSTPKSAFIILHLAISDFIWFLCSAILSTIWLVRETEDIPDSLCYIAGPLISFTRIASLVWTLVISFNVYMSTQKRKWFWRNQEDSWDIYLIIYYFLICCLALPSTVLTMIKQYGASDGGLGCSPAYEPIGLWYEVLFTEFFPILIGFALNMYVFFCVKDRMSTISYPQSVRKRRKRVMYHYIIVCILCWIPTLFFYIIEMAGFHIFLVVIIARGSLYCSGFLNFLVFGMQDPHLKRSFQVFLHSIGCKSNEQGKFSVKLKKNDVEKVVMFKEDTIIESADIVKGKRSLYLNHKLSVDEKNNLYLERPDLNPMFLGFNNQDDEDNYFNSLDNNNVVKRGCLKSSLKKCNQDEELCQQDLAEGGRIREEINNHDIEGEFIDDNENYTSNLKEPLLNQHNNAMKDQHDYSKFKRMEQKINNSSMNQSTSVDHTTPYSSISSLTDEDGILSRLSLLSGEVPFKEKAHKAKFTVRGKTVLKSMLRIGTTLHEEGDDDESEDEQDEEDDEFNSGL